METKPKRSQTQEIERLAKQCDQFESQVKDLTLDEMNKAPQLETEPQTKMSQKEINTRKTIVLKPARTIFAVDPKTGKANKFNEKFRKDYEFAKEIVEFVMENKECPGAAVTTWTLPFGGMPAEQWTVPANVPVAGPRYLAEQLRKCQYHKLTMSETQKPHASDELGEYCGQMVAKNTVQRIDAQPISSNKSIFSSVGA